MLVSLSTQALIFLCTVIGGLFVGFVYDLFRISRKVIKTNNWVIYLEDIFFWLIVSMIIFMVLFMCNAGEIRGYAIIGIVMGTIIYACTISHFVMKVSLGIIDFTVKIVTAIYKTLKRPIIIIFRIILIPFASLYRLLKKINKVFAKIKLRMDMILRLNFKQIKNTLKKF